MTPKEFRENLQKDLKWHKDRYADARELSGDNSVYSSGERATIATLKKVLKMFEDVEYGSLS